MAVVTRERFGYSASNWKGQSDELDTLLSVFVDMMTPIVPLHPVFPERRGRSVSAAGATDRPTTRRSWTTMTDTALHREVEGLEWLAGERWITLTLTSWRRTTQLL